MNIQEEEVPYKIVSVTVVPPSSPRQIIEEIDYGSPSTSDRSADPFDRALNRVVSSGMTSGEMFRLLTNHGCPDVTSWLDFRTCSSYPVSNGGYGDVFRARFFNGDEVAIKTMRVYETHHHSEGRYAKAAAREIYTWSKCSHPNVAELIGIVIFRGCLAMISRWAQKGNIMAYLERRPSTNRCRMSLEICNGLTYLHDQNIVHGDLKGANVLIANNGTPVLVDFGNATITGATLQFTRSTETGPSFSTRWTAPEILKGESAHTKAADVYSLGMTILEVLTGKVPYANVHELALIVHIVVKSSMPIRPLEVIPRNSVFGNILWAILTSCWTHNTNQRPTADDVRYMMSRIQRKGLVSVTSEAENGE